MLFANVAGDLLVLHVTRRGALLAVLNLLENALWQKLHLNPLGLVFYVRTLASVLTHLCAASAADVSLRVFEDEYYAGIAAHMWRRHDSFEERVFN